MTDLANQILNLRLSGLSYNSIAEQLGCSKGTVAYYCGAGQKEKNVERTKATRYKRSLAVAKMKEVPCADCGGTFGYWCMDFDHVSPEEKIDTVSNLLKYGTWQQVLDEIEKCEIVCSNCHRTRTRERGYDTWT